jgi:hypothetical protein
MGDSSNVGNAQHAQNAVSQATIPTHRSVLEQANCPHCGATGTCKLGLNGAACDDCADRISARFWQRFKNRTPNADAERRHFWCGVCLGKGRIEGATFKFLRLFPFFFAAAFVVCCFLVLWHLEKDSVDKLQGALTTLMGTIVGFYFGGKRSDA